MKMRWELVFAAYLILAGLLLYLMYPAPPLVDKGPGPQFTKKDGWASHETYEFFPDSGVMARNFDRQKEDGSLDFGFHVWLGDSREPVYKSWGNLNDKGIVTNYALHMGNNVWVEGKKGERIRYVVGPRVDKDKKVVMIFSLDTEEGDREREIPTTIPYEKYFP